MSPVTGSDGSCLMCQNKDWRLVVRSEDIEYRCKPGSFDLVECTRCGHVYVHPLPAYSEIPSLYPATYYTVNKKSPLYLDGYVYEKKLESDARKLRRSLQNFQIRSIVDVGCGEISRLVKLKEAFGGKIEAIALDIQFDDDIVRQAKEHGIKLVHGNVETDLQALRDEGHDLIIMRQLLEHLRDPQIAVKGLARKLAPNGLMIIDTPNRGGLDYGLFRKKFWGGYHVPRHFHLFTQSSLVQLIENAGLSIYRKGYLPSMGFWIISLRNMLGLNSIEAGRSVFEFLRYKNLLVAGSFIAFDTLRLKLGFQTSNQFVFAWKKPGV
ncbi:MAG: class I SAM-dependent methyltransferase [Verrucomicrobiota bacterium]|jgi:SAM-dependent methyltransferase